jgi:hypothetical protein
MLGRLLPTPAKVIGYENLQNDEPPLKSGGINFTLSHGNKRKSLSM